MRQLVIVLIGLAFLVATITADQQADGKKPKNAAELWARIKDSLKSNPGGEKLFKLISTLPGIGKKVSRVRRNNFGDLPVKCGPNQEKIDGECQDV